MSEKMKKIKIKGNDYIQVNERTMEFHRLYPDGSIKTEIVEMTNDRFITITVATPNVDIPDRCFTGIACESIPDENALENCETSSVGRALGFCNIGIDTSIASFEEVDRAISKEKEAKSKPSGSGNKTTGSGSGSVDTDLKFTINFGKHKGSKWSEVDEGYIKWVAEKSNVEWQRDEAKAELKKREGLITKPKEVSLEELKVDLEEVKVEDPKDVKEEEIPF